MGSGPHGAGCSSPYFSLNKVFKARPGWSAKVQVGRDRWLACLRATAFLGLRAQALGARSGLGLGVGAGTWLRRRPEEAFFTLVKRVSRRALLGRGGRVQRDCCEGSAEARRARQRRLRGRVPRLRRVAGLATGIFRSGIRAVSSPLALCALTGRGAGLAPARFPLF